MRELALAAAVLVGCGGEARQEPPRTQEAAAPPRAEQPKQRLAQWRMTLPEGWTSRYDADGDKWLFETPPIADGRTSNARFERAPRGAVAGPDAYLHYKLTKYWDKGTTAEFESREAIRDGFAMTVVVKAAADPDRPKRETFVVREIGGDWFQCLSEWVTDDAMRDQLLALCKSVKP